MQQRLRKLYLLLAPLSLLIIAALLAYGEKLYPLPMADGSATLDVPHAIPRLLMALVVIVAASKLFSKIFAAFNQPPVMGEVLAGIALGPSLLGRFFPAIETSLFPATIMPILNSIAQIGVILFMFVVGLEFDPRQLRKRGEASLLISHGSMVFPFILGLILALFIYPRFAPQTTSFLVFSLFIGVSVSVTAFPVLARIITDLGLSKSPMAVLTLACAAVDDISAWCLLALVSSLASSEPSTMLWTFGLTIAFLAFMLIAVRPLLMKLCENPKEPFALIVLFLLLAAWCTESIGIHALFGAFFLGVLIPSESRLATQLIGCLERLTTTLFLPVFFAYTGLRTQMQLLDSPEAWLLVAMVLFVAIFGKVGGTTFSARITGVPWRDSLAIGSLMNTRGLVELIVLNLGLDLGLLSPLLYAVFVLMALTTTLMTGPLFQLITRKAPWIAPRAAFAEAQGA